MKGHTQKKKRGKCIGFSCASETRLFVYLVVCFCLRLWISCALTGQDELAVLDPAAVGAHAQVYPRGVQAPLVGGGVVGARGAAVVPQPHVVKPHRRVSIAELCGRDAFFSDNISKRYGNPSTYRGSHQVNATLQRERRRTRGPAAPCVSTAAACL